MSGGISGLKAAGQQQQQGPAYFIKDGAIWRRMHTREGEVPVPLTNFVATITGEVVRDDGVEVTRQLELEATVEGQTIPFTLPAAEFAGMAWITRELGGRALVYPGQGVRDHARFAIQVLSKVYEVRRVFGHTGWREIGGGQAYLHGGGAISATGLRTDVETELGNELERFALPAPGKRKASLRLLDLAPLEITAPLVGLIYRAAIAPSDITGHLAGGTGVFKTELAALCQQHYAAQMDSRHLVGWHSTGNSLEAMAFAVKDALLVIDDYAPGGAASDVQRLQREAARLIRAQGNRSGRARLRPDGTLRPTKPPRCTILSTGEDTPGGQSIRARLLIIEVAAGDVDQGELTELQHQAAKGYFARTLAAFLEHLAGDLPGHRERFYQRAAELREEVPAGHRRTVWMAAELGAALEMYLEFADATDRWAECWEAIKACAEAQHGHQLAENPAQRFLALIGALLSSKQAHVGSADDPDHAPDDAGELGWARDDERTHWRPHGPQIGWIREGKPAEVYLIPEAAYAQAQKLATSQGAVIPVGAKTLWKRLAEGSLTIKNKGKNTLKVTIGARRVRVIAIPLHLLYAPEMGAMGAIGPNAAKPQVKCG
jgi:hypothetical protein